MSGRHEIGLSEARKSFWVGHDFSRANEAQQKSGLQRLRENYH